MAIDNAAGQRGISDKRAAPTKSERTRSRILDAAEEVFGRVGYHDASILEITQRAGVAQGTFYLHFPSKLDIFRHLIRTRGTELREAIRQAASGESDPAAAERAGFAAFFRWTARHPNVYRVARQAEYIDPLVAEEWYRVFAAHYSDALRRRMDEGALPRTDPNVLAWAVMGMADFTARRHTILQGGREIAPEKLDAFVAIALRALGYGD